MEMILTFGLWFVLIMLGIHVGYALIMASVFFFVVSDGWSLLPFALEQMFNGVNSQTLLAVPFFVLAGNLMNGGGVTTRIFDFAASMIGHRKGGLAHVNVLASLIFSGAFRRNTATCGYRLHSSICENSDFVPIPNASSVIPFSTSTTSAACPCRKHKQYVESVTRISPFWISVNSGRYILCPFRFSSYSSLIT